MRCSSSSRSSASSAVRETSLIISINRTRRRTSSYSCALAIAPAI